MLSHALAACCERLPRRRRREGPAPRMLGTQVGVGGANHVLWGRGTPVSQHGVHWQAK